VGLALVVVEEVRGVDAMRRPWTVGSRQVEPKETKTETEGSRRRTKGRWCGEIGGGAA
jgi:hypothetical protein